jgi:hypothetical protein
MASGRGEEDSSDEDDSSEDDLQEEELGNEEKGLSEEKGNHENGTTEEHCITHTVAESRESVVPLDNLEEMVSGMCDVKKQKLLIMLRSLSSEVDEVAAGADREELENDLINKTTKDTEISTMAAEQVEKGVEPVEVIELTQGTDLSTINSDVLVGKVRGRKSKKSKKKAGESDTQLTLFVNEKLIRYCKYYVDGRDSSPHKEVALFVKKFFFDKRYLVNGDFEGWWEAACLEIKPKIKTKRVNLMGNVSRIFKGK